MCIHHVVRTTVGAVRERNVIFVLTSVPVLQVVPVQGRERPDT